MRIQAYKQAKADSSECFRGILDQVTLSGHWLATGKLAGPVLDAA